MKKLLKWRKALKECKGLYFAELGVINFEVCQKRSFLLGSMWEAHWFNEKDMLNDCDTKRFSHFKEAKQWCEAEAIKREEVTK